MTTALATTTPVTVSLSNPPSGVKPSVWAEILSTGKAMAHDRLERYRQSITVPAGASPAAPVSPAVPATWNQRISEGMVIAGMSTLGAVSVPALLTAWPALARIERGGVSLSTEGLFSGGLLSIGLLSYAFGATGGTALLAAGVGSFNAWLSLETRRLVTAWTPSAAAPPAPSLITFPRAA